MKIAVLSDLHLEYYPDPEQALPAVPAAVEVLVLAGDIAPVGLAMVALHTFLDRSPALEILWVAGNHEFYGAASVERQRAMYARACAEHPRLHFLDNTALTLKGWRWLGTTLWSGFDVLGDIWTDIARDAARQQIRDFQRIGRGDDRFTPETAARLYDEARQWLAGELARGDPRRTIVITHFPPCLETTHPAFGVDTLTPYYHANCRALIDTYQPRLWLYGHNHWSQTLTLGATRLVSHQWGYPRERHANTDARPRVIDLNHLEETP